MAARGLTRKITAKQARSYEQLVPNGIGVTAIAALSNGKGRRMKARKPLRGAAFKRSPQYKKMMAGLRKYKAKKSHHGTARRVARRNGPASEYNKLFEAQMKAAKKTKKRKASAASVAGEPSAFAQAHYRKPKPTKAQKLAAAKRRAATAKKRSASTKKRLGRSYGPFRSLKAKIGSRSVPTYEYRGRGGKPRKIPLWAILGAKSKKDFERRQGDAPMARRIVAA
ncbi:MAG TPA: hypothetical protein VF905_12045, partial [Nitrospirota bacterium]